MKIVNVVPVIAVGCFVRCAAWADVQRRVHNAIEAVDWPPGTGSFLLYPQSGKKRGEGNGVKPIKEALAGKLREAGCELESKCVLPPAARPGPVDALLRTEHGPVAVEWESGNVSSSHRALNKLVLGLRQSHLVAGVLVLPSRAFARFLTDRIGTLPELAPYLELWATHADFITEGVLEIVEVEYDATSLDVPRIPKGTDGRSRR